MPSTVISVGDDHEEAPASSGCAPESRQINTCAVVSIIICLIGLGGMGFFLSTITSGGGGEVTSFLIGIITFLCFLIVLNILGILGDWKEIPCLLTVWKVYLGIICLGISFRIYIHLLTFNGYKSFWAILIDLLIGVQTIRSWKAANMRQLQINNRRALVSSKSQVGCGEKDLEDEQREFFAPNSE